MKKFEIITGNINHIMAEMPFYFNEDNSDVTVEPFRDGCVEVTVVFGTGKGWDTLTSTFNEAVKDSFDPWDYLVF